jgi:Cu2+-exporting ATPase
MSDHGSAHPDANHPASHTTHDAGGPGAHGAHDPELFRRRFWVSLVLTIPLVVTSHMVMDWFGYALDLPGMSWVGPVLGSIVFAWAGWPFLAGGAGEARDRRPGMMLLIAMAISVAYGSSMATSLGWLDLDFWWELAALVTVMLLGHWQEMKAVGRAHDALAALADLLPDEAERLEGDAVTVVARHELAVGDLVLVRGGGRVPADGVVEEGVAELDESMITGESRAVPKAAGDRVVAGTVSTDSSLRVRVTAVGDDTALAGIQRLVAAAQERRGRAQALADRFAALLFYVATAAAVVTFVAWTVAGDVDQAITSTVTVLVIACPHALGLAIPLVITISTAVGARAGIIVTDRLALERMRTIDVVLFDKTGTLTEGRPAVTDHATVTGMAPAEALRLAAAVEADSEHPLARALIAAAGPGAPPRATEFHALTGRGVQATVEGVELAVGGPALRRERGLAVPTTLGDAVAAWEERGATVLWLIREDVVVAAFALEDEVRPEAATAVAELRARGVEVAMITGDSRPVAAAVARRLGIEQIHAEVLPEDKDRAVAALQAQGRRVAMVGDGVNDAPALARADVGLAIGAGTDVAIESAGAVLAASDPRAVLGVIRLSQATARKMHQNLLWAAGYNVAAIPLAAGALAWAGVTLAPAVGALLMSASTIVVALNAQLLRRVQLMPDDPPRDDRVIPPRGRLERMDASARREAPGAKLALYGVLLVALLGGGAAAGAAFGPTPSGEASDRPTHEASAEAAPTPAGLAMAHDGYQLHLATDVVPAGEPNELSFHVSGPDGSALTDYEVAHDKQLHLVVVSRDLATFAHLHPERDATGTWRVTAPPLAPGSYRVYADFVPAGGSGMTLAADLSIPGTYEPQPLAAASTTATVDGYEVSFEGELAAGTESELTVTVRRDGRPVTDLQPYLGALGHLVAIRDGDLAYLHVHPLDETAGAGGPAVRFAVDVPSAGTYGLFFDFSHGEVVRTAAVITTASAVAADHLTRTEPAAPHGHGG